MTSTTCSTQLVDEPSLNPNVNATTLPILSTTPHNPPTPTTAHTMFTTSNLHYNQHRSTTQCRPTKCSRFGSWNIEGLSDVKLEELCIHMKKHKISVLCLQETHKTGCPYYWYNGFLVILSGSESQDREYAGTGFLIAPWIAKSVHSFTQHSNRLCNVKIRTFGGLISLISAYAPPNYDHNLDDRVEFFHKLGEFINKCKTHGPTYVLGDFNATKRTS